MVNPFTCHSGLRVTPLALEVLVKHYYARVLKGPNALPAGSLRREDLYYDEILNLIKTTLEDSTRHTVEELQDMFNARLPAPPAVVITRIVIPMASCDAAAAYLVEVLGGEELVKRLVGGTRWWQVRSVKGVNAQWLVTKKDLLKKSRWRKKRGGPEVKDADGQPPRGGEIFGVEWFDTHYHVEMDVMPCFLYFHGGGYFFGSSDTERLFLQRTARKVHGRVLAVDYRLAPQYPFPCAVQDALAAYLYLIRPPPGAPHAPVDPAKIVVGGDSAGGGLSIALLQVIREANLPRPAGAVLISPWSDLSHSFPSVLHNTDTDVIPACGLSFHKPSVLWPLEKDVLAVQKRREGAGRRLTTQLRFRRSKSLDTKNSAHANPENATTSSTGSKTNEIEVASSSDDDSVSYVNSLGETIVLREQLQIYAPNRLLTHPLISPALSYLGGLPPLFVIAGDKEVIRDEVIHIAHRAARPEAYPVRDSVRELYPALKGIEKSHGPTEVHLQVYDEAAHTLPVIFPFSIASKRCFEAIMSFFNFVTGVRPSTPATPGSHLEAVLPSLSSVTPSVPGSPNLGGEAQGLSTVSSAPRPQISKAAASPSKSLFGPFSNLVRPGSKKRNSSSVTGDKSDVNTSIYSVDSSTSAPPVGMAGHPAIYSSPSGQSPFSNFMIRERVSIRGVLRGLEPESMLPGCKMDPERIGIVSEPPAKRYIDAREDLRLRFVGTAQAVARHRARHIDTSKRATQLEKYFTQGRSSVASGGNEKGNSTAWEWVLGGEERPPPGSILTFVDVEEAARLSKISDGPVKANFVIPPVNTLSLPAIVVNGEAATGVPDVAVEPHLVATTVY